MHLRTALTLNVVLVALGAMSASMAADDTWAEPWRSVLDASQEQIDDSYKGTSFPYRSTVWREVMRCQPAQPMSVDAERTCLVCSIYDVGGLSFGDQRAPHTAVSIGLAYARFERDDAFQWALDRYEPIGSNHRATNGHFRHRASVRWIREEAVKECEDLHELVGIEAF